MCHMNLGYVLLNQGIVVQFLAKTRDLSFSFCTMTNKCTIISQITTLPHVSILLFHPQGVCNQYFAKLYRYFKCSSW